MSITKSGIGVDGHKFSIDGVANLNLKLLQTDGTFHIIEYEPVLISNAIDTPIFGIRTESRFQDCVRRGQDETLTYTTQKNSEVHCKIL